MSLAAAAPRRFEVHTGTRASMAVALAGGAILALLFAAPFVVDRVVLKDLIFVLTLVALAQYWNLLAGYAGIISIGQQAYVGFGGYLLFALTTFAGVDPVLAIALARSMGVWALVIGQLTAGLKVQARAATEREHRVRGLYEMSRDLSAALLPEQVGET